MEYLNAMTSIKWVLVFVLAVLFWSCKPKRESISTVELKQIVEEQNSILAAHFKEGNASKLAEIYTATAKLSPNGTRFIMGRDSIRAFWAKEFQESRVSKMETNVLTIDGNENIIYETGITTSEIIYKDSLYHARVKYINIWVRQPDNKFKLDVDFWNKDSN